jgi:hypothetical protein
MLEKDPERQRPIRKAKKTATVHFDAVLYGER